MKMNGLRVLVLGVAAAFASSEMSTYAAATSGGGAAAGGGAAGGSAAGGAAAGTAGSAAPSAAPFSPAQAGNAANQNNSTAPAAPATSGAAQQQLNQNQQGVTVVGTNGFVITTNVFASTNVLTTNQLGVGTNGVFTNRIAFTNQFAISNFIAFTNLFMATNAVSFTNHFGIGPADTAITEFDRTLIVAVRQRLFPLMQTAGGWAPISFLADRGGVVVFGEVVSIQERDQVISTVQTTPGVVQISNGLFINPQMFRSPATSTTGSISRFLQPASDPALGDYYLRSSTSNRLGQRTYIPPQRGTIVATNQNLPGVNVGGTPTTGGVNTTNLTPTGPTNALPIPLLELLTNSNSVTTPQ